MTGIGNAFPDIPLNLLNHLAAGTFERDDTYWTMVRIEQIRTRERRHNDQTPPGTRRTQRRHERRWL